MDYVSLHALLHPEKPAVADLALERSWNYGRLDGYISGCAAWLHARGIGTGDRVATLSKNRVELVVLHLACARIGAIFVPLNWRLSRVELEQLIADCEPSVFFGDATASGLALGAEDIGCLESECSGVANVPLPQPSEDLPSLMLYTSGTTGRPKGVMLSERNLTETAINFTLLGEVTEDSGFLCESPMFHIIGMVTSLRPAFLCGGHVVISDGFIPERTLNRLADPELRISHYFCVPQMAVALRAADNFDPDRLRGLKAIFTGGAPHPAAQILDWLEDDIAIVDGYGMSEAGTVFGMPLEKAKIAEKPGCVGIPTPRVRARLVNDQGEQVPTGEAGELQLQGDNIARGYWRREADFQAAMTDDGWFRTGDILTLDEDGYYRVTDRKKDMFISGGENVYPAEIEALLVKYPGIRESAVVGVPDEKWGEVGCLFYVAKNGEEVSGEEIAAYLAPQLAKYKIPQRTQAIDSLPRNGVGKVLKHELRDLFVRSHE